MRVSRGGYGDGAGSFRLVDHPGVLPIGFGELKRHGSIVGVLSERVKVYEAREKQFTYQSTDELPASIRTEATHFRLRAMLHRIAIQHIMQWQGG